MFRNRLYKPKTRCCIWRWSFGHHNHKQPVIRLLFFRTPWLSVGLHWLLAPDTEPWPHDHNMAFFSLILWGGYTEVRGTGDNLEDYWLQGVFGWNFFRASRNDWHRIVEVMPNTVTLFIMGPEVRVSGVHTPTGWISRKDYNANLQAD